MPTIQEIINQFMRGEEPPPDPSTIDSQGRPIQPGAQRFNLQSGGPDPATSDLMSILSRVIQEEAVSDPFARLREQELGPMERRHRDLINSLDFEQRLRFSPTVRGDQRVTPQANQRESDQPTIRLPTQQRPGAPAGSTIGRSIPDQRPTPTPTRAPRPAPTTALRDAPTTGSRIGASIPAPGPGRHPDISALVNSIHRSPNALVPEGFPFPVMQPLTGPSVSLPPVRSAPEGGPDVFPPSETGEPFPFPFPPPQALRSAATNGQIGAGFQPTVTDRLNNAQRDRLLAMGQGPSTVPFDAALEGVPANSLPGPASQPSPLPLRAAAPAPPMPANLPPEAVQPQSPPATMGNEIPEAFKAAILDSLRKATLASHQPR